MSIFKKLFKKESKKNKFFTLPVVEIVRETSKAVTLIFDKPEIDFDFLPGQYLTLKTQIDGNEVRRAYSLSSLPEDMTMRVTVKETPDGYFSKYVNQKVTIGDLFDVLPPKGHFKFSPIKNAKRNIVGFAGGSGITPIMSILKSVLFNEPNSTFTLFFGNTTTKEIIFANELKALEQKYPNRLQIIHVLSEELNSAEKFKGFINEQMITEFSKEFFTINDATIFYLCGPAVMTETIVSSLKTLGAKDESIHRELFTAPVNETKPIDASNKAGIVDNATIKVIYNGEVNQIQYSNRSKTLLDAVLDNNINVPFSCMNGVCSSCSCKVEEGKIHMENIYTLEKEELEEGFVLSCQSKPTTKNLVINFDDNRV